MRFCPHCEGELLRHGMTHYKRDESMIGIRYKCRECRKSFTVRIPKKDDYYDPIRFNQTVRPYQCDWRMKDITKGNRT